MKALPPIATAFLALAGASGCGAERPLAAAPNVLIVVADDLANRALAERGAEGGPLAPNLARLAAGGVRFERAVASSPFCTPSRQSFLTGRWPHAIGVTQIDSELPEGTPTLATVFGARGYRCAAIGKMHWQEKRFPGRAYDFDRVVNVHDWTEQLDADERALYESWRDAWRARDEPGWTRYNAEGAALALPPERHSASFFVDETLAFVRSSDRPFLAVCSFHEPHAPFNYPAELEARVDPDALASFAPDLERLEREVPGLAAHVRSLEGRHGTPTAEDRRGFLVSYLRSVAWLDDRVGVLLAGLEAAGHADDTIVVFWSDHGFFLGEHGLFGKNFPFREVVETPLVVRLPQARRALRGARRELVQLLDVFPTLCELTGTPPPADLDGRSLVPLLERGEPVRDEAFCEFVGMWGALQTEDWKLVLGARATSGLDQLYDLRTDPGETRNLVRDPARRGLVEDLARRLERRAHEGLPDAPPPPAPDKAVPAARAALRGAGR